MNQIHPVFATSCACGVKNISGKYFHVTRRAIHREVNGKKVYGKLFHVTSRDIHKGVNSNILYLKKTLKDL